MAQESSERHLVIDEQRCQACRRCEVLRACRGMAVLRFERDEPPVIDVSRCKTCLVCVDHCPYAAVVWRYSIMQDASVRVFGKESEEVELPRYSDTQLILS